MFTDEVNRKGGGLGPKEGMFTDEVNRKGGGLGP